MKLFHVRGTVFNLEQLVRVEVSTRTLTLTDGSTLVLSVAEFTRLRESLEVRNLASTDGKETL